MFVSLFVFPFGRRPALSYDLDIVFSRKSLHAMYNPYYHGTWSADMGCCITFRYLSSLLGTFTVSRGESGTRRDKSRHCFSLKDCVEMST
jgi:hypothetical protein